jgi:hypothetical protein
MRAPLTEFGQRQSEFGLRRHAMCQGYEPARRMIAGRNRPRKERPTMEDQKLTARDQELIREPAFANLEAVWCALKAAWTSAPATARERFELEVLGLKPAANGDGGAGCPPRFLCRTRSPSGAERHAHQRAMARKD